MKQICLLEQETIDKIAAGEVVERPASVVKELTENAVDAGASAVTIEIREGGISFIRVTDNGEGIDRDQIRTAFLRHATSKIRHVEDLQNILSLGFRGEALSSICAVSQMELITKTPGSLVGSRYLIEGGKEQSLEEIGAPQGSTFLVKNLFYNTPARRKFLKSPTSEGGYVSELVEHLALSHPEISFKLIVGGQTKLHTSGNGNLKDVIYSIYGRQIAASLIPVDRRQGQAHITGFIGKPVISRGNRRYEHFFINGRYIRSQILSGAIEEGYRNFLMQHRYPFTALKLQLEGSSVDVNVHPAKMEVRFADSAGLYQLVCEMIRAALAHRELIPSSSVSSDQELRREERLESARRLEAAKTAPEPFERVRRAHLARTDSPYQPRYPVFAHHVQGASPFAAKDEPKDGKAFLRERGPAYRTEEKTQESPDGSGGGEAGSAEAAEGAKAGAGDQKMPSPRQMELFEEKLLTPEALPRHRLIGQLFDTYWLIEFEESLYIIDQHAAHEKVMYEKFCWALAQKSFTSQMISPALIVTLTVQEGEKLERFRDLFTSVGFQIEPFGGREYAITAVPDDFYGFTDTSLFIEMLDHLSEDTGGMTQDLLNHKLATMACKAAVKGGMHLSTAEADELIRQLLTLDNPYHCPHGRPTIISMSKRELEKKFKRIV